jgi:hypothetical protein
MIDVDENGGIHVIFYDDRRYNQESDQPDSDPNAPPSKYDVFYAYSNNSGQSFDNFELFEDPDEPALDLNLQVSGRFQLRDYIGIDVRGDRVFTSFMGASTQDQNNNKSVIWSSQILLPGP